MLQEAGMRTEIFNRRNKYLLPIIFIEIRWRFQHIGMNNNGVVIFYGEETFIENAVHIATHCNAVAWKKRSFMRLGHNVRSFEIVKSVTRNDSASYSALFSIGIHDEVVESTAIKEVCPH